VKRQNRSTLSGKRVAAVAKTIGLFSASISSMTHVTCSANSRQIFSASQPKISVAVKTKYCETIQMHHIQTQF
jgi:hypothetical protein